MAIIDATHYLDQLLSATELERIAKAVGFCQRRRDITPAALVSALLSGLGCDKVDGIAGLHRHFNGLQLTASQQVAYKPFHNQLRKETFPVFMKRLVERAIALRLKQSMAEKTMLSCFRQVLLHDGTSFALHPQLAERFPGRFKTVSPAAVECHMTMSLLEQCPLHMSISADTEPERKYLPEAATMSNSLILADAGYVDRSYFTELDQAGGSYLVRGTQGLNPVVITAYRSDGKALQRLAGKPIKDINRRTCREEVLDMDVRSGKFRYRLIRRWFAEEKRFCLWMTNLPRTNWSAAQIMSLYRCRWQVELLFKELKSHNRLKAFATKQAALADGLIWASLLSLLVKRRLAQTLAGKQTLSMLKAAKNAAIWLAPILEAKLHGARSDMRMRLESAETYLVTNARKAKQRKSIENKTLGGILNAFSS